MGHREHGEELFSGLLEFGEILGSALGSAQSLEVEVRVDGDAAAGEQLDDQEVWGEAALLWRPADPDSAGGPEALVLRRGDELVIVASKDRRWQISLEKGEVCVRALGASPAAKILLKPNGDIEVDGEKVLIGGTAATEGIALGDALQSYLSSLKTAFDTHTHSYLPGPGAATPTATPLPTAPAVPTVASAKHKVEP